MKPPILLLWDIDGTILTTGGAGEEALKDSIERHFGIRHTLEGIEVAGRTDKLIAMQVLQHFQKEQSMENISRFLDGYLDALIHRLPACEANGKLHPGVQDILEEIHTSRPNIMQGLLTGNLERGARLKLEHYNASNFFSFGAFADDHHDRNQISAIAKQRAEGVFGLQFPSDQVFVIGDTPHDVACGQAIAARTVAVATGKFSAAQLKACGADFVFEDFSDTAAFFAAVDP